MYKASNFLGYSLLPCNGVRARESFQLIAQLHKPTLSPRKESSFGGGGWENRCVEEMNGLDLFPESLFLSLQPVYTPTLVSDLVKEGRVLQAAAGAYHIVALVGDEESRRVRSEEDYG